MFAKAEWTIYKPSKRVGKLCYYLCSDRSVLPIRDVLNSHRKGFKEEPNYETATYNWCAKCNQRSVAAAVKDGLYDPEFATFTYGDNVNQKQNLNDLNEGDFLFSLARLVPYNERFHHNKAIFALIGYLEIAERLDNVVDVNPAFNQNAHILRWKADSSSFEGFAIFKGSVNSRRFRYAVPFNRKFVEEVSILTANGQRWNWTGKTELSAIGSYTRAVRLHIDPSNDNDKMRANRFWHLIRQKQRWETEN